MVKWRTSPIMKLVVFLPVIFVIVSGQSPSESFLDKLGLDDLFKNFVDKHKPDGDHNDLKGVFKNNALKVVLQNIESDLGMNKSRLSLTDAMKGLTSLVGGDKLPNLDFDVLYKKFLEKFRPSNSGFKLPSDEKRKDYFIETIVNIAKHNLQFDLGHHSFKMGVNPFADLSQSERHILMSGSSDVDGDEDDTSTSSPVKQAGGAPAPTAKPANIPPSFDYRQNGKVGPVKHQQQCNSCWAFAVVGVVESANAISSGRFVSLSEQQLLDCGVRPDGAHFGCKPSSTKKGFDYLKKPDSKGLNSDRDYPYRGSEQQCMFRQGGFQAKVYDSGSVPKDEEKMKEFLVTHGPLSVTIGENENWMWYRGGIFDDPQCPTAAGHALVLVGYGSENGRDYWIVKNGWGTDWGEGGYMRMIRGKNMCGIRNWVQWAKTRK